MPEVADPAGADGSSLTGPSGAWGAISGYVHQELGPLAKLRIKSALVRDTQATDEGGAVDSVKFERIATLDAPRCCWADTLK